MRNYNNDNKIEIDTGMVTLQLPLRYLSVARHMQMLEMGRKDMGTLPGEATVTGKKKANVKEKHAGCMVG